MSPSSSSDPRWALAPPENLPPGRLLTIADRGEFFVRDSGADGPPVLLLHGWMFAADLNWGLAYASLAQAGYRVIALDHRGHGRGLRTPAPFRLSDCAADAAAVIDALHCGPVIAVGYSMGGPIAALMARDHRAEVRGTVLCATATNWQDPRTKLVWRTMGILRLVLGLFSLRVWRWALPRWGMADTPQTTWLSAELARGDAQALAEAGRELGRFDSRPWIGSLDLPSAVVLTSRDRSVAPRNQRALAAALGAPVFEVAADHFAVSQATEQFNGALLAALSSVTSQLGAAGAQAPIPASSG